MEKERLKMLLNVVAILAVASAVAILVMRIFSPYHENYTTKVEQLFSEYNVNLDPVYCTQTLLDGNNSKLTAYYCTVDANINISDKNVTAEFVARGNLLVLQEGNKLYLYKLEPSTNEILRKTPITDDVKNVITKVTLIMDNYALCKEWTSNSDIECYIPTNKAPLGNAIIIYAPLFELVKDDSGNITRVIVHV